MIWRTIHNIRATTIILLVLLSNPLQSAADDYDDHQFFFFNVYTPNGGRVGAMQHLWHYDTAYWDRVTEKWDEEFAGLFLYRISKATYEYNCHAYTFADRCPDKEEKDQYWINNCKPYLRDFSYQEVGIEDATIAVYNSENELNLHSICMFDSLTVDGQQVVTSKWGSAPIYRHVLFQDIYNTPKNNPDSTLTRYFRLWPDPWIIEEDTTLEMMEGKNFRRSLGSITVSSGVTVIIPRHDTLMMHADKSIDIEGTLVIKKGARITRCIGTSDFNAEWRPDDDWGYLTVKRGGILVIHRDSTIDSMAGIRVEKGGMVFFYDGPETQVDELKPGLISLQQPYPNPFNASTTISYELPHAGHANLTIYSTHGQKIATLVDNIVDAGMHTVVFSGDGLPSGTYIARLTAIDGAVTRKMLLVK